MKCKEGSEKGINNATQDEQIGLSCILSETHFSQAHLSLPSFWNRQVTKLDSLIVLYL